MENNPTFLLVVAGALRRDDGLWLMHKRPLTAHHGGLWEFPGGKVESSETPANALIRELEEELAIAVPHDAIAPAAFAEEPSDLRERPIVIMLYTIDRWVGEPTPIPGAEVGWFTPEEIAALSRPPLDIALAAKLFAESGQ